METLLERPKQPMTRKKINNRDFVVAYMTCDSIDDVARTMELSNGTVISKATNLRKMGVKLPKRFSGRSKFGRDLEVAQLNSLVNKYMKKGA